MHGGTEAGDDPGIHLVVLRAEQLALGKSFNACWVDDADLLSCIIQEGGQFVTIGARGFQTRMDMIDPLLLEPGREFHEPFLIVGEDLMFQLVIDEKRYIKLPLGNINTEYSFYHNNPPFLRATFSVHALSESTLHIQTLPCVRRFTIPYELHGQGYGKGISSTNHVRRHQVEDRFTLPGIP